MKISAKQLRAFMASEAKGLDGIGFNDNWNVATFGLTRKESALILRAMTDVYGLRCCWVAHPNLAAINARLQEIPC